jgi:serine acetyltransferase
MLLGKTASATAQRHILQGVLLGKTAGATAQRHILHGDAVG